MRQDSGNTLNTALNINKLSGVNFTDTVGGSSDVRDIYRFSLRDRSNFHASLDSPGGASVGLIRDANRNGIIDNPKEIIATSKYGDAVSVSKKLERGTYFISITSEQAQTNYNLKLSASPLDLKNNSLVNTRDYFRTTQFEQNRPVHNN